MHEVAEKGVFYRTLYFYDKDNTAMTPASASYKITDLKTGQTIRDWTSIGGLSTSVELTLSGDDNKIINSRSRREKRELLVKWIDSEGNEQRSESFYWVVNTSGQT